MLRRSRVWIEEETALRDRFVKQRLKHEPEDLEAMDLTQFMHGGRGCFYSCQRCGTLVRNEAAQGQYESDVYDTALMRHLFPRYVDSFSEKKSQYQNLLRPGAEVVELGSHLGAFLQTAEEWGWRPIGVDIGRSTSAFARQQGLTVRQLDLQEYSPTVRQPEALFIWNCFEQLENASEILMRSYQMLDRWGLLVVRVPNATFYCKERYKLTNVRSGQALRMLGYNNLLGFPYLHGYTQAALERLLRLHSFEPLATHNSSLLTTPYPDMSSEMQKQWLEVRRDSEALPIGEGPWIEVVSRRVTTD